MQIKLFFTGRVLYIAKFESESFWNSEQANHAWKIVRQDAQKA